MTKDKMKRNIMHSIMELRTKDMVEEDCILDVLDDNLDPYITDLEKELEAEKKLNEEIKVRFVKCNTCTDEMKNKCLMFSENLCEGDRCEELVDLIDLINKSDLQKENARLTTNEKTLLAERKIIIKENAELKALIEKMRWHTVADGDLPDDRRNVYVVYLNGENLYEKTIASYRYKYWVIDGHKTECEIVAWYELPTWGK